MTTDGANKRRKVEGTGVHVRFGTHQKHRTCPQYRRSFGRLTTRQATTAANEVRAT
jgi:hypothetical protein